MCRRIGDDPEPSVLSVVLDCSPTSWAERPCIDLGLFVEHALTFVNAFWMLDAGNQLMLFGAHPAQVRRMWPLTASDAAAAGDPHALRRAVADGVRELVSLGVDAEAASVPAVSSRAAEAAAPAAREASAGSSFGPLFSVALSLSFCRIQRVRRASARMQPRVLLLSASEDDRSQHLALINAAFAAQKLEVLVDVVVLRSQPGVLLQQVAHLTGGIYHEANERTRLGLAHYLLSCCLPDQYSRRFVRPPMQGVLETRGVCTLTHEPVDIGWTCSVCLAVFSRSNLPSCPVCATRFTVQLPLGRVAPRKKARRAASARVGAAPAVAAPGSST